MESWTVKAAEGKTVSASTADMDLVIKAESGGTIALQQDTWCRSFSGPENAGTFEFAGHTLHVGAGGFKLIAGTAASKPHGAFNSKAPGWIQLEADCDGAWYDPKYGNAEYAVALLGIRLNGHTLNLVDTVVVQSIIGPGTVTSKDGAQLDLNYTGAYYPTAMDALQGDVRITGNARWKVDKAADGAFMSGNLDASGTTGDVQFNLSAGHQFTVEGGLVLSDRGIRFVHGFDPVNPGVLALACPKKTGIPYLGLGYANLGCVSVRFLSGEYVLGQMARDPSDSLLTHRVDFGAADVELTKRLDLAGINVKMGPAVLKAAGVVPGVPKTGIAG